MTSLAFAMAYNSKMPITEKMLKELSARSMLQDLSEIRMVHLKGGKAEYRIRTELSPTANAIFHAADVPVPRRVSPVL